MNVKNFLEATLKKIWFGGKEEMPFWCGLSQWALYPAELLYRMWLEGVETASRTGPDKALKIRQPVISVGNITVGGSGKSTFCMFLARRLEHWGYRAAVVSHSYGRKRGSKKAVVFRGDEVDLPSWKQVGDEAYMMARMEPSLLVIGGADKAVSLKLASGTKADIVIIDDAFHRRDIHRDLDVVLFDADRGLGNKHCIPAGPLREPLSALNRAHAFVISRNADEGIPENLEKLFHSINPAAPVINAVKVPSGLAIWPSNEAVDTGYLDKRRIFAFCALGNPESFMKSLADAGARIVGNAVFRDHHSYSTRDLDRISREGSRAGAEAIVTTAKDVVKITEWKKGNLPLMVFKVGLSLGGRKDWLDGRMRELTRAADRQSSPGNIR